MADAVKLVRVILLVVALGCLAYALWRTLAGAPLPDSLPLFVAAMICGAVSIAISRRRGGPDQGED